MTDTPPLAGPEPPPATGTAAAAPPPVELTDRAGQVWAFTLDPPAVAHVRDVLGIDFERMAHAPAGVAAFVQLLVQPRRAGEVVWLLCAANVRARGLTAADFLDALDGDQAATPCGVGRPGAALAVAVARRWPGSPLAAALRANFDTGGPE